MKIEIEDQLLEGLNLSPNEARLDLAIGLFVDRRVTLGRGARIAGLSQTAFLQELGRRHIPVHYDLDDLASDLQTIRELGL